jgi:DNA-binding winged helix-turn-helix (wHTH) protein/Tfp pilus assembly protein PilF
VYRFGTFVADLSSRTLSNNGERLLLTPKAFDTLAVLLEHAGDIVDKQTLMEEVWPDAHVEEGNLSQNIFVLRKLLGENAREHRFIATVPGRGYCFVGKVHTNGGDEPAVTELRATSTPRDEPQPGAPIGRGGSSRRASWPLRPWHVVTVGVVVLLAVTGSLALARLAAIRGLPPPPPGHSQNRAAYDAYLKGRYFWNKRTMPDLVRSLDFFNEAVRHDPKYALAYAGLADTYAMLNRSEAYVAARQALALDPNLAGPHATLGSMALFGDWNWDEAGRELRAAIAVDGSYATAHHWYAYYQAVTGHPNQAIQEIQLAAELDPVSLIIATDRGHLLYLGRRFDEAIGQFHRVLEMDQGFVMAHWHLGETLQAQARWEDAADEFRLTGMPTLQPFGDALINRRHAVERLRELSPPNSTMHAYYLAQTMAAVGARDNALAELEHARSRREPEFMFVAVDPVFDTLRDDPKFQALARTVGMKPVP